MAVHRKVVLGSQAGGGPGVEGVGVQPDDQYVVRGASARDGPGPQRAEGAEDVQVQQGLAGSRGDDLFHAVQRQLLLGGADVAPAPCRWPLAASDPRDGGGLGRSRVVAQGVADLPCRSVILRHDRAVWANVGAWNLIGWWHTLVELWAWDRPHARLCDRRDSPWDKAERRPSHADRCRSLRREALEEEYSRLPSLAGMRPKIRRFVQGLMRRVARG